MKTYFLLSAPFIPLYDNDNDALIAQQWAAESVEILYENMVAARLVHTDFSDEIQSHGNVVNTRKPNAFTAKRKIDSEDVTVQDAVSTNIAVPLDQHFHTSFTIKDGEESLSFKDLVNLYLDPAIRSIGQQIDRVVLAQVHRFAFDNVSGGIGTTPTKATLLAARNVMNKNNAHVSGRNLVLTPDTETDLLNIDAFTEANKLGDDGTALAEASLGRKLQFSIYMAQNTPSVVTGSDATATTTTAIAAKAATLVKVTSASGWAAGQFCTFATDMKPHLITAITTKDISIWPPLKAEIASGVVATTYAQNDIDQTLSTVAAGATTSTDGYRAGWHGYINMTGSMSLNPEVGTMVTFGTYNSQALALATAKYIIIDVVGDTFLLDRPLDAAVADAVKINYGPIGEYNMGFHRNAIALVTRPLAKPRTGVGALSGVANDADNGISIRVVITYLGVSQGHLVTVDMLAGVALLEEDLGVCYLS